MLYLYTKNNTAIQTYTGLVIRWGDGKQDTVYQLNEFFHKYDLPASLKASCQNDTILRLTVCITAFKQCNEGFTCSQKVLKLFANASLTVYQFFHVIEIPDHDLLKFGCF